MTRKMVEVVTDETAVVIPVLFAVIIKKKKNTKLNVKMSNHVFTRFIYVYVYMAAVTFFPILYSIRLEII